MKPKKLIINTKTQKYPIFIGSNLIPKLSNLIKDSSINFDKCLLLIDKNISKNIISQIKKSLGNKKIFFFFIKASEINKNQKKY